MPDAGDEIGEVFESKTVEFLEILGKGVAGSYSRRTIVNNYGVAEAAEEAHAELDAHALEEAESAADAGLPCEVCCAESAEDAAALANELSEQGVELHFDLADALGEPVYAADAATASPASELEPGADGIYRIYLPRREAEEARALGYVPLDEAEGVGDLLAANSLSEARQRLAVERACSEAAAKAAPALASELSPFSETLDFETVSWDREGKIVSRCLDALGVPCERAAIAPDAVRFTFNAAHAPAVKAVADELVGRVRGIDQRRFPNYDALAQAAKQETQRVIRDPSFSRIFVSQDQAAECFAALDACGIGYEAIAAEGAKGYEVVVDELSVDEGKIESYQRYVADARGAGRAAPAPSRASVAEARAELDARGAKTLRRSEVADRARDAAPPTPAADEKHFKELARHVPSHEAARATSRSR